jgi:hypothetical protein
VTAPPTLDAEARRLFLRYAEEVVEALGFCPWARDARLAGRVRIEVLMEADVEHTARVVDAVERDTAHDIGILLFPTIVLDRVAFRRFAADVRDRCAATAANDDARVAIADFHPNAEADLASPERLVAFVRRSPDPLLQLVRERALASVRKVADVGTRFLDLEALSDAPTKSSVPAESVSERVARANLRTVERLGVADVRARIEAIHADRDRSYARLGLSPAPWALPSGNLRTT